MLMLAWLTGCTILPRLFGNDHAAQRAQELQELQAKVMRFAVGCVAVCCRRRLPGTLCSHWTAWQDLIGALHCRAVNT
jgi:hypothetical protein